MKKGAALTDEEITGFIVRMLACYRENRDTIRTMILVCTIGGCCFFVFGIIGSLESIRILQDGVTAALNRYLHFPTILFTLGIPLISLFSSYYFWKFSKIRDVRLERFEKSENTRKRTLVPNQP